MNCYHLNLNFDPLVTNYDLSYCRSAWHRKLNITRDLNLELLEFLKSKNVYVNHVETFYSFPFMVHPIHTDSDGHIITKMNFIVGGKDSKMHWYKTRPDSKFELKTTAIGTLYKEYHPDQVDLIESASIGYPSLVRADILHNVSNCREARLCVSLTLVDRENNFLTIEDCMNKLAPPVGIEPTSTL